MVEGVIRLDASPLFRIQNTSNLKPAWYVFFCSQNIFLHVNKNHLSTSTSKVNTATIFNFTALDDLLFEAHFYQEDDFKKSHLILGIFGTVKS